MTNYTHTQSYTLTFSSLSTSGSDSVRAIEGDPVTSIKKERINLLLLLAPTPFFWVLLRFFLDRLSVEGVTERAPMLLAFFSALSLSFTLYLYLTLDRIITLL